MRELSYSQLSTWLSCRKKWYYHYKEGLISKKFIANRDRGSAFHAMLAETKGLYDFDTYQRVWGKQIDNCIKEYQERGWNSDDVSKEWNAGLVWGKKVIGKANEVGISSIWSRYSPEVEFVEEVHHGLGVRMRGFLDGIVTIKADCAYGYQGERKIVEHKTTGAYQEGNIELDLQQGIYQLIHGLESLYIWYTSNGIKVIPFKFNDVALYNVQRIVDVVVEEMYNAEDYIRCPSGACYNYCDYGQLCIAEFHGGDVDYLKTEAFTRRIEDISDDRD